MSKLRQSMTLAWTKQLAPNVIHIALSPSENFDYVPGQFISLHLNDQKAEKEVKRSYSIANPPKSSEFIEFAISYLPNGVASEHVFNMQLGDKVEVSGPAGRLVLLEEHPKRYVLVATGTGVTPYRAMLNQIKNIMDSNGTKFLLIFGVRNPQECLYFDEFQEFANSHENFDFHIFYSRELPKDLATNTHKGYVQSGFDQFDLNPNEDMVYLCGNPDMIDQAFAELNKRDFTARNVRREKYISGK